MKNKTLNCGTWYDAGSEEALEIKELTWRAKDLRWLSERTPVRTMALLNLPSPYPYAQDGNVTTFLSTVRCLPGILRVSTDPETNAVKIEKLS